MMKVPTGGTAGFDADMDEDTIEMMLTPADMSLLAQAAEEQQQAADVAPRRATSASRDSLLCAPVAEPVSHAPTTDSILPSMPSPTTSTHNSASLARGALAGVAGALVIIVAIASLSTTRLTKEAKSSPLPETPQLVDTARAGAAAAGAASPEPSLPVVAEAQPLRFKNPFDKSEVFEFPAGTTLEEARASVADLLRQRAQDRHIRPGLQHSRINGAVTRRSAKQAAMAQTAKRG